MAQTREANLLLRTQVEGTDALRGVANELRELAAQGGAAAPEFQRLSAELDKLAQQQDLVAEFNQLSTAVDGSKTALASARAAAENSRQSLVGLTEALRQAEAAENAQGREVARATRQLAEANAAYREARAALSAYAAEIGGARNAVGQQKVEMQGLRQAVLDSKASFDAAQASLARLTPEYNQLKTATSSVGRIVAGLEQEMQSATKSSRTFGEAIKSALTQFGPATLVFNAVTSALSLFTTTAQKIPAVVVEFESMGRALKTLTGSTEGARREFAYLQRVANHVGADVKQLGDAYISLAAATKGTNLEGAQTKRIFEAVSGAMGVLGKSSSETEGALRAVSQMIGKGVVSMEEMRQQLAERLPGAMQATARELGITEGEFVQLISSGKLMAADILPAMSAGLEKLYETSKRNDTLAGQWTQLTNAAKTYGNAMGEDVLKPMLAFAREALAAVAHLGEGIAFFGKMVVVAGDSLIGLFKWDWSRIKTGMAYLTEEATKMNERVATLAGSSDNAAKTMRLLAEEAQKSGKEFFTTADGVKILTADVIGASNAWIAYIVQATEQQRIAEEQVTAARKVAETTRAAGEAAIQAANAIGTEADKRRVAAQAALDNAAALQVFLEKERELLRLKEEEAMQRAIEIRDSVNASEEKKKELVKLGEEITQRRQVTEGIAAQVEANKNLAAATAAEARAALDNSASLATLRQAYLDAAASAAVANEAVQMGMLAKTAGAQADRDAFAAAKLYTDAVKDQGTVIQAVAALSGNEKVIKDAAIEATKLQTQALKDLGQARTDEAKRLELQLEKLQIERQALEDNSKNVTQFAAAYRDAKAAVEELTAAKSAGLDVADRLAAAEMKLAQASALYKDAAKDKQAAIAANLAVQKEQLSVEEASIRLAIEQQRTIYEVARATGDERAAAAALVEIKRLEIQLAQLQAQAKKAEADAALLTVQAKRAELEASGQLTAAKEAELKAQEAAAQAKQLEAQIAEETAKRMELLAEATNKAGDAAGGAAGKYSELTGALGGVERAATNAAGALDKVDKKRGSGMLGDVQVSTDGYMRDMVFKAGGDMQAADDINKYYEMAKARVFKSAPHSYKEYTDMLKQSEKSALAMALEATREREDKAAGRSSPGAGSTALPTTPPAQTLPDVPSAPPLSPSPQQSGGSQHVVKIQVGSAPAQRIGVNSAADAAALTGIMRQIEQAASVAAR